VQILLEKSARCLHWSFSAKTQNYDPLPFDAVDRWIRVPMGLDGLIQTAIENDVLLILNAMKSDASK